MTKPKRPRDQNQLAKLIVDITTGETPDDSADTADKGKDPAAVALGRKGGLKGGMARAEKLSPQRRSEIAKLAAKSRWTGDGSQVEQRMTQVWKKKLSRSDAQVETRGALMPFLRFTKKGAPVGDPSWFRNNFFANLNWQQTYSSLGHQKEIARIKVHVRLPGNYLGVRTMTLDHDPQRKRNHVAPTMHLLYDDATRQALEATNLAGHDVIVEMDGSGNCCLTVK